MKQQQRRNNDGDKNIKILVLLKKSILFLLIASEHYKNLNYNLLIKNIIFQCTPTHALN